MKLDRTTKPKCECDHPDNAFKPFFTAQDHFTMHTFSVGYCRRCGLHVTRPAPSETDIAKYYPPAYYGTGRRFAYVVEGMLDAIYRYRVWDIEREQSPGKALDIGCGRGLLLHKLREHGWDVRGIELSENAASYARNVLQLPVTAHSLRDACYPDNEFDLVILWHVLEHMHSPQSVLSEVRRILKPGGRLLLAVPNFGSWEARWGREHWFHLNVPGHLTHFTPTTLRRILKEANLVVSRERFFSTEYDFFSLAQTTYNKLGLRYNRLYNSFRTPPAKVENINSTQHGTLRRHLQDLGVIISAVPLVAAGLVYAPLAAALRRGATIALVAKKPK